MSEHLDWRLLDRYLAGAASPAESASVERWLAAHPAEAAGVDALRDTLAADARDWDVAQGWATVSERLATPPAPAIRLTPPARRPRRWVPWTAAAALAAALAGVFFGWNAGLFTRAAAPEAPLAELATPAGRRATLQLSDGTVVRLDAGSRLRYPARLAPGAARELYLDGQAYFAVTHDAARPFIVHAGGALVTDLGTEFGVSAFGGASPVRVVVTRGQVAVAARGGSRALGAGELARVDAGGAVQVTRVDVRPYIAWTEGVLAFDGRPLGEVAPELGRWYGVQVRVPDAALARRAVTAELRGESLAQALDALALTLGARWQRSGDTIVVRPGRQP